MSASDVLFVLVRGPLPHGAAPHIDGGERSAMATAAALEGRGVRCSFVLTGEDDLSRELDRQGIPYQIVSVGDPMSGIVSSSWRQRLERVARLVRSNAAVFARARADRAKIVHASGVPAVLSSGFGARLAGAKLVFHVRDLSRTGKTRWYEVAAMLLAGRTVAISQSLRDSLIATAAPAVRSLLAGRIEAVYNGFDFAAIDAALAARPRAETRAALGVAPATFHLVSVGGIWERKGQLRLIEQVMPRLAAAMPAARMTFVGGVKDEAYAADCRAAVARLRLGERVIFAGGMPLDQVYRWYQAADVAVLASAQEGLSRFAVEAQAFGLPVVTTRVVGPIDVVREGETGFLVPNEPLDEMVDRLLVLARDPALRRRMGEAGAAQVRQRFSLAQHLDGILGVYQRIGGWPARSGAWNGERNHAMNARPDGGD